MTYRDQSIPTGHLRDVIPAVNFPSLHSAAPETRWIAPVRGPSGPAVVFHQGTPGTWAVAKALLSSTPGTPVGGLSRREYYLLKARLRHNFPNIGRPPEHVFLGSSSFLFVAAALELEPQLTGSAQGAYCLRYVGSMTTAASGHIARDDVAGWTSDALADFHEQMSSAGYRLKRLRAKGATRTTRGVGS